MSLDAAEARIREDWANITSIAALRDGDTIWIAVGRPDTGLWRLS